MPSPHFSAGIYSELKAAEPVVMGSMVSHGWRGDPRRLGFTLARYKFVSKMLAGYESVLEVGCGDGFASVVVAREVGHLTAVDVDGEFIEAAGVGNIGFHEMDMVDSMVDWDTFDAVYALDVLEHIEPKDECIFMRNITGSLAEPGVCIIGMPSLESQAYASELSRAGHVNCKTRDGLRETMLRYFRSVFMFGMNDEVLHTGYGPMCHYHLAMGVGLR